MTLTEAEAKTKWCPMVRGATGVAGEGYGNERGQCVGSGCMMWRHGWKRNPDWKSHHSMMASYPPPHPDDQPDTHVPDTERGYCGLGGRP